MNKSLLVAVALVLALGAGYGISMLVTTQMKAPAALCGGANEHCIEVKITNNTISVDVDELYVSPPNAPEHAIFWTIKTHGYTFDPDAISFVTAPLPPPNEFHNCRVHPGSHDQTFVCNDRNSTPGKYKYTIKVNGPAPVPPALDPTIKNG